MNYGNVIFHPEFKATVSDYVEVEEAKCKLAAVTGKEIFKRIESIVDKERSGKRVAFYETITEAAMYGSDFSKVETIKDIADIYARFIVGQVFGE